MHFEKNHDIPDRNLMIGLHVLQRCVRQANGQMELTLSPHGEVVTISDKMGKKKLRDWILTKVPIETETRDI